MQDINTVAITGNLTRDPELKQTQGGSVCKLRIANNARRKQGDQWVDAPNYFDVTIWGSQGENVAQYMSKGRKVAITGKLRWREWESDDGKRQAVEIVADNVAFMGGKEGASQNGSTSDIPVSAPAAAAPTGSNDDIPF